MRGTWQGSGMRGTWQTTGSSGADMLRAAVPVLVAASVVWTIVAWLSANLWLAVGVAAVMAAVGAGGLGAVAVVSRRVARSRHVIVSGVLAERLRGEYSRALPARIPVALPAPRRALEGRVFAPGVPVAGIMERERRGR